MKASTTGWSILLPGDIEGAAATAVANALGTTLQSTVYKMAHHGASTSANQISWLTPIRPLQAFASNAYNFGNCRHPRCVTINRLLNLNSVTPATPHPLHCGNYPAPPTPMNNFCHSMYATAPTANQLCLITSSSSGQIGQNCMLASAFTTGLDPEDIEDNECQQEITDGEELGGSAPATSIYNQIIVLILACIVCMQL